MHCVLSHFSCVQLFATLWTVHQAPLSMGFSRQEYWSELPFLSPGDLPDPGIEPGSPASQADCLPLLLLLHKYLQGQGAKNRDNYFLFKKKRQINFL